MYVMKNTNKDLRFAESITRAASTQTYYTIRFLADRERVANAYRAYAYFRWVDDVLDAQDSSGVTRHAFVKRQQALLDGCYTGQSPRELCPEEEMLIRLVQSDTETDSGLQFYLRNMMAVMVFDVKRRGRLISQSELNEYTSWLAGAVTEAMHYFIGHGCYAPHGEVRTMAVTAAHITHMLRDTVDDTQAGYFNVPREVLEAGYITPLDLQSDAYRAWVRSRVDLARLYFKRGRDHLNRVANPRCRFAGLAYAARFEWLLSTIEQEGYRLRPHYNERKSIGTGLQMAWLAVVPLINSNDANLSAQAIRADQHSLR